MSRRLGDGLIARLPVGFFNGGLQGGANRTRANKLAKGTEGISFLGGVQIRSAPVLELASAHDDVVVMEDFRKEQVDDRGEQHSHEQGTHPASITEMSHSPQADNSPVRNQNPNYCQPE